MTRYCRMVSCENLKARRSAYFFRPRTLPSITVYLQ